MAAAWCALSVVLILRLARAQTVQAVHPSEYLAHQVNAPNYHVNDVWKKHVHLSNYEEIERAARDTFTALPHEYESTHRNPCWFEDKTTFKCMPYFQILGVSKCGTTDLYNRLVEHPDMVDCSWKGPHFWDEASYPVRTKRAGRYDGSFPAYVAIFDKPAAKIRANPAAITGEASSNTFTAVYSHLRGRTLSKRVNATLAEYLWEASPWARYIVMFRDPVTRYRSAFFYYRTKALPTATDKEYLLRVKEDIAEWRSCLEAHAQLHCLKLYQPQQLVKGMYGEFVPAWLRVWPRQQMLFMRTEDYKAAPVEHVTAAIKFLGLRELQQTEMKGILSLASKNTQASKYNDAESESPDLAAANKLLQEFYKPYNQRLSALLNNDPRWLWDY